MLSNHEGAFHSQCGPCEALIRLHGVLNPLTAVTAIWRFDAITHAAIHQTRPDKFLTRFDTQCAYSET